MLTLVEYKINYADEFDVYGFKIADEKWIKAYDEIVEKSKKINVFDFLEINHYFGSNEEIIFNNLRELQQAYTFTQITTEVATQLTELFKTMSYGRYGMFFDIVERLGYILKEDFDEEYL